MKQYFTNYKNWEDWQNGMWRTIDKDEEEPMLLKAIEFTGNAELYGSFMLKVIENWPECTKVNLTNLGQNRKAWIGHAACCMAINCPENITRSAWWKLTDKQRLEANQKADEAIKLWESNYKN